MTPIPNADLYGSRVESFGRFAPAAGAFAIDPSNPNNAQFFTDNGLDAAATPTLSMVEEMLKAANA